MRIELLWSSYFCDQLGSTSEFRYRQEVETGIIDANTYCDQYVIN